VVPQTVPVRQADLSEGEENINRRTGNNYVLIFPLIAIGCVGAWKVIRRIRSLALA
jgi:hypothetical protein